MSKASTAVLTSKTYSLKQAERLTGAKAQTIRRWLHGYEAPGHRMRPVFAKRPQPEGPIVLSFLELAELIVVARFRRGSGQRMPLWRLRDAHAFARERLGIEYPFASGRLKVEGGHIMAAFQDEYPGPGRLAVDIGGAWALPLEFSDTLEMFDFGGPNGLATRFYPIGKDRPVVIDPEHAAGQPTIVGRNVRIAVLRARWDAGWEISDIADDFSLSAREVEAALRATAA